MLGVAARRPVMVGNREWWWLTHAAHRWPAAAGLHMTWATNTLPPTPASSPNAGGAGAGVCRGGPPGPGAHCACRLPLPVLCQLL